jgi:hypothetical protein
MADYLVPCKVCGMQVSNKAKVCPHCGKKLKMSLWLKIVIGFFVLAAINVARTNMSGGSTSSGSSYSEMNNNVVVDERSPEEIKNEFILTCKGYDYREISRNPDNYLSEPCKFKGKVIQVQESGLNVTLRINVTEGSYGSWDDTIYVDYKRLDSAESRILDDDIIMIYGTLNGIKTYTTVLRSKMSIPWVKAKYIEIN